MKQMGFELKDATTASEQAEQAEEVIEDAHVYSVSELNKKIRDQLEGQYSEIWIQGEISNFKPHTSGHFYFSLKDKTSQISAVMFRGLNSKLKFKPKDGQMVLVRGKVTVYEPRGSYQIFCEVMEPMGAGALQLAYEQLKNKLQSEGLFSPDRKRALPALPSHVALVTSPTGAAVKDMLNVLGRRYKGLKITIVPVLVQGEKAAPSIVEGIRLANLLKDVEVLIVGRGGGSIEDLWAFNEEIVARAIAQSQKPIISAVGHEVDFTIADFVADLRAPTPSAAAELVVKNAQDIISRVELQKRRLWNSLKSQLHARNQKVQSFNKRLIDPRRKLQDLILRCDELTLRLEQSTKRNIENLLFKIHSLQKRLGRPQDKILRISEQLKYLNKNLNQNIVNLLNKKRSLLEQKMLLIDSLSPLKVLDRGFAIVKSEGRILKTTKGLSAGDKLQIQLSQGTAEVSIDRVES